MANVDTTASEFSNVPLKITVRQLFRLSNYFVPTAEIVCRQVSWGIAGEKGSQPIYENFPHNTEIFYIQNKY